MGLSVTDDGTTDIGAGEGLDGGEDGFEAGSYAGAGDGCGVDRTAGGIFGGDAGDAGCVLMEGVEAQLVGNKEPDQDAAGQADGQPEDIDKRKGFFPEEVSEGEFQVVLYHI